MLKNSYYFITKIFAQLYTGNWFLDLKSSKVPLVVFKREKEIARTLEFDGLYITEQPSDDDIKGQWDRLVINTPYVKQKAPFTKWSL